MAEYPVRKNLRVKTWDYTSDGTYFLTFCTTAHRCLLSMIRRGDLYGRPPLTLTALGQCVDQAIREQTAAAGIQVHHQVIMPNHVHLLISLARATTRVAPTEGDERAAIKAAPTSVGNLVGAIKSRALCLARQQGLPTAGLWQRGYHDHIIRNTDDFQAIWTYIDQNPQKWELDRYYTDTEKEHPPCRPS